MSSSWIAPLSGIAALVVAFVIVAMMMRSKSKSQAHQLPGDWESRRAGVHIYELKFRQGGSNQKKHPSMLWLRLGTSSRLELEIKSESWFDRLGKTLGIAREFQTGDRAFDARFYLRGEIDTRAGMALKQPEVRAAIRALFDAGCTQLKHQDQRIEAQWRGFDPAARAAPGDAEVAAMAQIAAGLPTGSSVQAPSQMLAKFALWSITIALGASFVLGIDYTPVRTWDLWRWVLPAALLLWLTLAWIAAFSLRGHSRAHDHWGALIAVSLLTAVIGVRGLLGWCNGHFDHSPLVVQQSPVIDKWTERRKSRSAYLLSIADWKFPGKTLKFEVEASEYLRAQPGSSQLIVNTHAGRLGIEWQQSFSLKN